MNNKQTSENIFTYIGLSLSKKSWFYLLQWKAFKNDEKSFLFHVNSSFRSQDI